MDEKINRERLKIISLILLFFGLFLIGFGITGKIILNSYTLSDYCNSDAECVSGKICCDVPGTQAMCQDYQVCNQLKSFSQETPIKNDYSLYSNIGIFIVISAIILIIIAYFSREKEKKKKKR